MILDQMRKHKSEHRIIIRESYQYRVCLQLGLNGTIYVYLWNRGRNKFTKRFSFSGDNIIGYTLLSVKRKTFIKGYKQPRETGLSTVTSDKFIYNYGKRIMTIKDGVNYSHMSFDTSLVPLQRRRTK